MYNKLAPFYREYSIGRSSYILAVDKILQKELTADKNSLLDLGAGDGERLLNALREHKTYLDNIYMVENSPNMIKQINCPTYAKIIQDDFSSKTFNLKKQFDVISCLWNVLGHISERNILQALTNIKHHLSPKGIAIIDINNRQNIKQYKWNAIKNCFKDIFLYNYKNGDINFSMDIRGNIVPAKVHLFSCNEFEGLIEKSGLIIKKRHFINYQTGKKVRNRFSGQICYILSLKI